MTRQDQLRITVTPETCSGTGVCAFYAANTFDLDDDGKVTVVSEDGDAEADVRIAAEACPTRSIQLGTAG